MPAKAFTMRWTRGSFSKQCPSWSHRLGGMGNVKLSYVHPKGGLRIVPAISLSPTPIPFMEIIRIRNKQPAVDIRAIKSCYPILLSPRGINPGWNLVIRPNYLSKNGPNCGKLISIDLLMLYNINPTKKFAKKKKLL